MSEGIDERVFRDGRRMADEPGDAAFCFVRLLFFVFGACVTRDLGALLDWTGLAGLDWTGRRSEGDAHAGILVLFSAPWAGMPRRALSR